MRTDRIGAPILLVLLWSWGLPARPVLAQQWTPVYLPPEAGWITAPRGSTEGLYSIFWATASTSLGLWRRPWNTGTWELLGFAGNTPLDVRVSGLDHRVVFMSCYTGDQRFFVSHDDGGNWTGKTGPPQAIAPIGVDRQWPQVVYGAANPMDMYASHDEGDSWGLWDNGWVNLFWGDVAAAPVSPLVGWSLHGGLQGSFVLKTTDGGVSWQNDIHFPRVMGEARGRLAVTPAYPDAVFVLCEGRLVENISGSWTEHPLPPDYIGRAVAIPYWAPQTIYIGGELIQGPERHPAAYKTTDFGETWSDISSGLPPVSLGDPVYDVGMDWHPTDGILVLSYDNPPLLFLRQEDISADAWAWQAPGGGEIALLPNPSAGAVMIRIPAHRRDEGAVEAERGPIEILDVLGRHVRTLRADQNRWDAAIDISWDGRTETGEPAVPGVYFVRAGRVAPAKLLIVR